jgi:hypothetical protein
MSSAFPRPPDSPEPLGYLEGVKREADRRLRRRRNRWLVTASVVAAGGAAAGGLVAVLPGTRSTASVQTLGAGPSDSPSPAAPNSGLSQCPSPNGLEPFDAEATQGAVAEAGSYGHDSESSDLANSDPSWQAQVHASWSQNGASNDKIVVGSPRSADSLDAAMIIRHACGDNLVTESIAVPVRPQSANTTGCNACAYTVFFVNRGGQPLVYFVY